MIQFSKDGAWLNLPHIVYDTKPVDYFQYKFDMLLFYEALFLSFHTPAAASWGPFY